MSSTAARPSALSIVTALFPLSVTLSLTLSACSTTPAPTQIPALPANLAQPCPPIDPLPQPFIPPLSLEWTEKLIRQYGDCGAKVRLIAEAWPS